MDQLTIQAIREQLDHHVKTITALDNAMEEIAALKQQVEILQSIQGTMPRSWDLATHREATCDSTLQQHSHQLEDIMGSQIKVMVQ